jgi:hypothetical protein
MWILLIEVIRLEQIITIMGNAKYTITLDPSVWIFDERKVDLTTYFNEPFKAKEDTYMKDVSKHWDREISQGASLPEKTNKITYNREKLLKGTFGMPLAPFIQNAVPSPDASRLIVETSEQKQYKLSLENVHNAILGFSLDGKPLTEDGPAHFYYGDGSNQKSPIRNVRRLIIE